MKFLLVLVAVLCDINLTCAGPVGTAVVYFKPSNLTEKDIDVQKPHHLLIGRCTPRDELLYQDNFVFENESQAHVIANFQINIGPHKMACVKILDQMPLGEGAYPVYKTGGVGYTYVSFEVTPAYGKGFKFHVEIYKKPPAK